MSDPLLITAGVGGTAAAVGGSIHALFKWKERKRDVANLKKTKENLEKTLKPIPLNLILHVSSIDEELAGFLRKVRIDYPLSGIYEEDEWTCIHFGWTRYALKIKDGRVTHIRDITGKVDKLVPGIWNSIHV